ncbi:MAG: trypsin-like peptidase domain-containing protein [Pseudomonadota bacterium]|nr:trypsin-like peptidase domain-containing protein [Pseudomonadota bacterium]
MRVLQFAIILLVGFGPWSAPLPEAQAAPQEVLDSVVSVLPVWPGRGQGGAGAAPGAVPEGSGVVVRPGIVATALHVIEPAERIDIRLRDGRILPARLIAGDVASDIAVLQVNADLPPFRLAPPPSLVEPVCAVGNAYGLGLSVTCGVVSALAVTNAGFNPVEDFVQTDAATNPGMSGGALVDSEGRLVGMLSAIFASDADSNIGINFAVSAELLVRVVDALIADGAVDYPAPGWRLMPPDAAQLTRIAAPVVGALAEDGAAARAGIREGDLILRIRDRRVRTPRDAVTAIAVIADIAGPVPVLIERNGAEQTILLSFNGSPPTTEQDPPAPSASDDCPYGSAVCRMRQAVFPISSFDPIGSATRIGEMLLVTNRHVVADRMDAVVNTPDGPLNGTVLPSAYAGDLVLIEVSSLPASGFIPPLVADDPKPDAAFHAVGADVARQQVRVFEPGGLIALPAEGAALGRLHVSAQMQPGVSGGALVDGEGNLVAIAVGGGDGRYEAIPIVDVRRLLDLRDSPDAAERHRELGAAFRACAEGLDAIADGAAAEDRLRQVGALCGAADNHGQLLDAGRVLGRSGDFDGAIAMHGQAVQQVPNSINARISLLVSLQIGGRFAEMTEHARVLMGMAPKDPQALRFAIQSGVWGGDPDLAEEAYKLLLIADPRQAEAARRFLDNPPPAPPKR